MKRIWCIVCMTPLALAFACERDTVEEAPPDPLAPTEGAQPETADTPPPAARGPEPEAPEGDDIGTSWHPVRMARAELSGAEGSGIQGIVLLRELEGEVVIEAQLAGFEPGMHGFHIHEKGECQAPDFKSAGGHFNPTDAPHAGPAADAHHAGDLGNVDIGTNGMAFFRIAPDDITLDDTKSSVVGKAFVVHAGEDDLESQPSGAAGARKACGIIQKMGGE